MQASLKTLVGSPLKGYLDFSGINSNKVGLLIKMNLRRNTTSN